MPRPVEALPCGSRSMMSTRSPIAASAVPRLIAVVVLPTPPFWLAIDRMRGGCGTPGRASARNGRISPVVSMSAMDFTSVRPRFEGCSSDSFLGAAAAQASQHDDATLRAGLARNEVGLDRPIFSGLGQFSLYILTLQEQRL